MFATKPGLFSIGTIVVLIIIWSYQPVKLITSTSLNLVEQVIVHVEPLSKLHVSFVIHVKLIFVLHVKIVISPNTFQQHLPLTFFQPKGGELEIDEMHVQIKVQNPFIIG